MDPLAALGLAGNIIQFVQFASGLLNSTRKIYASASGASENCECLDSIYSRLSAFNVQLQTWAEHQAVNKAGLNLYEDLEKSATACANDCQTLLSLLNKLKVKGTSKKGWWQSFAVAIREVWRSSELDALKARVEENQRVMVLQFCAISNKTINTVATDIHQLKREAGAIHQNFVGYLEGIRSSVDKLSKQVDSIERNVVGSDGCDVRRNLLYDEIEALTAKVTECSISPRKLEKEQALLLALNFDARHLRKEEIPEAYRRTFAWIFDTSNQTQELQQDVNRPDFVRWLESGNGSFWISGKPGSGKSTLMKVIADAEQTRQHLAQWADRKKVVIVHHYIWNAGSRIQRSITGLLRALLYGLLIQVPELIELLCGEMIDNGNPLELRNQAFQRGKLLSILAKLPFSLQKVPVKICFIIDGLDELEGELPEVCDFLVAWRSSPDMKLCAASRPWNIFEDYFGHDPTKKLYIHHLTTNDIKYYTESRLYGHSKWCQVRAGQEALAALVDEVAKRAEGVFLWVTLVIKMLCEGLTNDDSFTDLRKRLQSVPDDLELFFKQILSSVEPFYHRKMVGALQMALAADSPLRLQLYSFHELEYDDQDYALKLPVKAMSQSAREQFHAPTSRRLNAWCKGLIESHQDRVQFIHRTVRDFLRTEAMTEFLRSKAFENFCPMLSIIRAKLAFMKSNQFMNEDLVGHKYQQDDEFNQILDDVFYLVHRLQHANPNTQDSCHDLLDDLERSLERMVASQQIHHLKISPGDADTSSGFRLRVIVNDLHKYLARNLQDNPKYLDNLSESPLSYICNQWIGEITKTSSDDCGRYSGELDYPQVIEVLLSYHNDINEKVYERWSDGLTTPWTEILNLLHIRGPSMPMSNYPDEEHAEREYPINLILRSDLLSLLLRHGADPNVSFQSSEGHRSICWVSWLFLPFDAPNLADFATQYLNVLNLMFASGANLQCMSINLAASSNSWPQFCYRIKALNSVRLTNPRRELLANTIVAFARFSKGRLTDWDQLLSILHNTFSQDQYRRIREALSMAPANSTTSMGPPSLKRRRYAATSRPIDLGSKKIRWLAPPLPATKLESRRLSRMRFE